jgi:drug/metabolite transporter (DMT)-like permease
VLFQTSSVGSDGLEKQFQKPLFQNMGMFLGMTLCLVIFEFQKCTQRSGEESLPLKADAATIQAAMVPVRGSDNRVYYMVLVPAICDFLATYLMNIGLLWINASIWQMVRGSIIFFVAMIRWAWLKRKIHLFQWVGVLVVMLALCIIGYACINMSDTSTLQSSDYEKLAGVLLVFLAQLVQAIQCVVEEHLLHDINASDLQVVGLEGFWGLVLCVGVAMPAAYYLPYQGLHEDTWDTLTMIMNSHKLFFLFTVYVFVILGFNMFAMKVTMYINSVTRNILDTIRTMFIWVIMVSTHYLVSEKFGESWSNWSLLELAGFGVLLSGLFTYYKVITLSCLDYPDDDAPPAPHIEGTPMLYGASPAPPSAGIPGSPHM